jgi:hypothetical protein
MGPESAGLHEAYGHLPEHRPREGRLGLEQPVEQLPRDGEHLRVALGAHPRDPGGVRDQQCELAEEAAALDVEVQVAALHHDGTVEHHEQPNPGSPAWAST